MNTKKNLHSSVINNSEATEKRVKNVLADYITNLKDLKLRASNLKTKIQNLNK